MVTGKAYPWCFRTLQDLKTMFLAIVSIFKQLCPYLQPPEITVGKVLHPAYALVSFMLVKIIVQTSPLTYIELCLEAVSEHIVHVVVELRLSCFETSQRLKWNDKATIRSHHRYQIHTYLVSMVTVNAMQCVKGSV